MIQNSSNQIKKIFDLNSVISYISRTLPNYLTTVLIITVLSQTYSVFNSKDYWLFIRDNIINIFYIFLSFFNHSQAYCIANLILISVILYIINFFRSKSWRKKIKYNQKEQVSFYVSQLLTQGNKISSVDDLRNFCQDTVDIIHNIFVQKSTINNTAWLIPNNGKRLELFCKNKSSKYNKNDDHFSFSAEEGVVGNSWATGKIEFYSEKQENRYYKNRIQCTDIAYICCPILEKPLNEYGIISVGSDEDIYWESEDTESLKLISTVISNILNNLDDELKTQLNLQTLQG